MGVRCYLYVCVLMVYSAIQRHRIERAPDVRVAGIERDLYRVAGIERGLYRGRERALYGVPLYRTRPIQRQRESAPAVEAVSVVLGF
jgi:hypothetical protein